MLLSTVFADYERTSLVAPTKFRLPIKVQTARSRKLRVKQVRLCRLCDTAGRSAIRPTGLAVAEIRRRIETLAR